jgi:two-component system, NarL family, response regulator NreC
MTIRVVIADDHPVVRNGVKALLDAEADIDVVGEAGDATRAVFETIEQKPDVIVLDLTMPGVEGMSLVEKLRQTAPGSRIVVLSMHDSARHVRDAHAAGASGYVPKEAADADLVAAVRLVARGEQYVHPTLGAKLAVDQIEERRRADADPLSAREREVLGLLARGHTNQEVAKRLFISVRTAETHRAHIMRKLRLETRAELVRYAMDNGLLKNTS